MRIHLCSGSHFGDGGGFPAVTEGGDIMYWHGLIDGALTVIVLEIADLVVFAVRTKKK